MYNFLSTLVVECYGWLTKLDMYYTVCMQNNNLVEFREGSLDEHVYKAERKENARKKMNFLFYQNADQPWDGLINDLIFFSIISN